MSDATWDFILNDGASKSADAGYDIQNNFSKFREEMAKFNPENGAWYTATFTLTPDGNFKFDFDYDHLPAFDIIPSPGKWVDEFKHYPRPELQAHVQDWMDKKAEHSVIVARLRELQLK
jgi:hypothetical protein